MNVKTATPAENSNEASAPKSLGISKDQMAEIITAAVGGATTVAQQVASKVTADYIASAQPEIEKRAEEQAHKAVGEALARKQKTSALKTYGTQAAVSAGVFALGTLAMAGVDKMRNRNNNDRNRNSDGQFTTA